MDVQGAIDAWREVLGASGMASDTATLGQYSQSMQRRTPDPACVVLYPTSTAQVQAVVRVARQFRVPVHPLSRGKNWGYGDAAAPHRRAAIVDLKRMSRILEINRELAYVVLEPGVSQGQLYAALQEQAPELWMDCTGAGLDASVVGNVLERGFGHTPYGDHSRTTSALEVVLGTGEVLRTGFSRFPGAAAAPVFPQGVGPSLQDLFTQSAFGIVTRMTVWLYPRPAAFRCCFLLAREEDALPALLDTLRELRLSGVLNSAVHVGNDLRVLSSQQGYPWAETGGLKPLPEAVRQRLRRDAGLGAWNLTASLAGSRSQVTGAAAAVKQRLRRFGRVIMVDDRRLALAQGTHRVLARLGMGAGLGRKLALLAPNYGLLKGIPTDAPLQGVYWRMRSLPDPVPLNPLETSCGLYWLSPVLPLTGRAAYTLMEKMTPIFQQHGFDLPVTFTLLNERSMVAVMNIAFDQGVDGEAAQAEACYEAALKVLLDQGFVPYRTAPRSMPKLTGSDAVYSQAITGLKAVFDPDGIISPGRYSGPVSTPP